MTQSRLAKTLARGAVVSWREQPTQYDIEALRANIERVGLVIRVRWAIVAMLAGFSVVAALVYGLYTDPAELISNMTIPAITLVFVLMYNSMYQLTYRKVGNIAFLNHAQLIFDALVVTVLVYYSGGVYSWFASMYLLFILEAAFILPRRSDVWGVVAACSLMYGVVIFGEYLGLFPHVNVPFYDNRLSAHLAYALMRYLWHITLFGGAALVGMLMTRSIRKREAELRESSFIDDLTGLFNRQYFHRVLYTEVERAVRNRRKVALVVADIDSFSEINRVFGVEVGDEILHAIGGRLRDVSDADAGVAARNMNTSCRIGGEELALILPDIARNEEDNTPLEERALAVAESFRRAVELTRVSGVSVTVSVGVALAPDGGDTPDSLIDTADRMLSLAALAGGNTVRASWMALGGSQDDE